MNRVLELKLTEEGKDCECACGCYEWDGGNYMNHRERYGDGVVTQEEKESSTTPDSEEEADDDTLTDEDEDEEDAVCSETESTSISFEGVLVPKFFASSSHKRERGGDEFVGVDGDVDDNSVALSVWQEEMARYVKRRRESKPTWLSEEEFKSELEFTRTDVMERHHQLESSAYPPPTGPMMNKGVPQWVDMRLHSMEVISSGIELYRQSRELEDAYSEQEVQLKADSEYVEMLETENAQWERRYLSALRKKIDEQRNTPTPVVTSSEHRTFSPIIVRRTFKR